MTLMREQMMLMDSIEKANNPELKNQAKAIEKMKKNEKEMDYFLNSTLVVTKASKILISIQFTDNEKIILSRQSSTKILRVLLEVEYVSDYSRMCMWEIQKLQKVLLSMH